MNKIKFVCETILWYDRVNGNTYHASEITRTSDGATLNCPLQYGHSEHYRQTAREAMLKAGWLPKKYNKFGDAWNYERENDYPIHWIVSDGLKRDAVALGSQ